MHACARLRILSGPSMSQPVLLACSLESSTVWTSNSNFTLPTFRCVCSQHSATMHVVKRIEHLLSIGAVGFFEARHSLRRWPPDPGLADSAKLNFSAFNTTLHTCMSRMAHLSSGLVFMQTIQLMGNIHRDPWDTASSG
jgi:hypothetical protein